MRYRQLGACAVATLVALLACAGLVGMHGADTDRLVGVPEVGRAHAELGAAIERSSSEDPAARVHVESLSRPGPSATSVEAGSQIARVALPYDVTAYMYDAPANTAQQTQRNGTIESVAEPPISGPNGADAANLFSFSLELVAAKGGASGAGWLGKARSALASDRGSVGLAGLDPSTPARAFGPVRSTIA